MTTRLNVIAHPLAVSRGEKLVAFLERREIFLTAEDFMTYLRLRNVLRYRITVLPNGDMIFALPRMKLRVMHDAAAHRMRGSSWMVKPLGWWQRGRQINEDPRIQVVR